MYLFLNVIKKKNFLLFLNYCLFVYNFYFIYKIKEIVFKINGAIAVNYALQKKIEIVAIQFKDAQIFMDFNIFVIGVAGLTVAIFLVFLSISNPHISPNDSKIDSIMNVLGRAICHGLENLYINTEISNSILTKNGVLTINTIDYCGFFN